MKSIGIVRKVDELGRVCLPMETRRLLGFETKTSVEMYIDGKKLCIEKYEPGCCLCGNAGKLTNVAGLDLCDSCKAMIKRELLSEDNQ